MYAWNNSPWDDSDSPQFSTTGETPAGMGLSARFDGGENGYTADGSVNSWSPTEWTIEMAVKLDHLSGWQTMIGRNGSSQGEASADFYFQKENINDHFRINFDTLGGQRYILDSDFQVVPNQWYYLAVVSDGNDLTMYADDLDGNGSQVVGTMELNPDNDNALAAPSEGYAWTIGRSWYDGYAVDQMTGNLDDIRFTNRVLSPSEFLNYQCGAWGYLDNDLNFNCWVDYPDFAMLAAGWDGTLAVLEDFVSEWLMTTQPYVDGAVNMLP